MITLRSGPTHVRLAHAVALGPRLHALCASRLLLSGPMLPMYNRIAASSGSTAGLLDQRDLMERDYGWTSLALRRGLPRKMANAALGCPLECKTILVGNRFAEANNDPRLVSTSDVACPCPNSPSPTPRIRVYASGMREFESLTPQPFKSSARLHNRLSSMKLVSSA